MCAQIQEEPALEVPTSERPMPPLVASVEARGHRQQEIDHNVECEYEGDQLIQHEEHSQPSIDGSW